MMSIKQKIVSYFKPNKYKWRLVEYPKEPKVWGLILLILFLILNFIFWKLIGRVIPIIPYIAMFYLDLKAFKIFFEWRKQNDSELENRLRYVIHSNKLYDEEVIETRENQKIVNKKEVTRVIRIWYKETAEKVYISIERNGDRFTIKGTEITEFITSGIGLEHEETIVNIDYVDLTYMKKRPERLYVLNSDKREINKSLNINLGYGITYSPVDCPHILVAGGTGSGKSVFITWLIIELLKNKGTTLYMADIKHSDLGSLKFLLGDDKVATTPNNIARIIRLAVEEMKKRYEYMNDTKNFIYGSNFADHGFKPVWILFDEMGAFQANATDKKSKEVISEVMDGIKQIILLGRQSGVFCLISAQQMSANTLNTDLRDNLGLRIILGSNSQSGYRMVLGEAVPEIIPPIEVKGSGLLYMQGSGKESAQYWESPYVDMKKFDFIEELKKYI